MNLEPYIRSRSLTGRDNDTVIVCCDGVCRRRSVLHKGGLGRQVDKNEHSHVIVGSDKRGLPWRKSLAVEPSRRTTYQRAGGRFSERRLIVAGEAAEFLDAVAGEDVGCGCVFWGGASEGLSDMMHQADLGIADGAHAVDVVKRGAEDALGDVGGVGHR
jgi:hypothetical protein